MYTITVLICGTERPHTYAPALLTEAYSVARELSRDYHSLAYVKAGERVIATYDNGRLVG